jgi:cell wall-associated NlpC family hydrolase
MVLTAGKTAAARTQLKEQALLAYLAGGAPLASSTPGPSARSDPTLTASYAEIIAGGRRRAIDAYRQVLADQSHQGDQLAAGRSEAAITLSNLQADRSAVNQTLSSQKATLAQVRGRLATVVAEVQAARQKAQQAAVEASLARQGQLPPGSGSPSTATPVVSHAPAKPPAPAPKTTAAPTNSRNSGTPSSPAPSTDPPAAGPPAAGPPAAGPPTTNPPVASGNTAAPGAQLAIAYARAQIGKPYQWGGAGPDSFDCSGLTMMAWEQAGVYLLHSAQDQYDVTRRVALSQLLPGDLVFYGTPSDVHHVGLYIGNGNMIAAPETGEVVQIQSIFWGDLLGAGRV